MTKAFPAPLPASADIAARLTQADLEFHQGRISEAIALYRSILRASPRHDEAALRLGVALVKARRPEEAVRILTTLTRRLPGAAQGWIALGSALLTWGKASEAHAALVEALHLEPNNLAAIHGMGQIELAMGEARAAEASFRKAIQGGAKGSEVQFNLGLALYLQQQLPDAEMAWLAAVVQETPNLAWNLALAALKQEHWARGWTLAEARFNRTDRPVPYRHPDIRTWTGELLSVGKLLLWGDQGLGDQLMFGRFIAQAKERSSNLALHVAPPLVRLLRHTFPEIDVQPIGSTAERPLAQLALGSLPRVLGLARDDQLAANASYLRLPPLLSEQWARRLGPRSQPRIGLAWAGNPEHPGDGERSAGLAALAPLMALGDRCEFHSLQAGPRSADLSGSTWPIVDWSAQLADMCETAALIANLDLVITVDTAVAHLAGALGKPVWILLPANSDWRWSPQRQDRTLWYADAWLIRQVTPGDWEAPIARIAERIRERFPPVAVQSGQTSAPPTDLPGCLAVLALRPLDRPALERLSQLAMRLADPKPALSSLHRGRTWPVAAQSLAALLLRLGKRKVALDILRALTGHSPERMEPWLARSDLARLLHHGEEASGCARRAIALDGSSADAWLHLANGLREQQKSSEALEAIEKAAQLDPRSTSIQNNLGVLFREQGRLDEAVAAYERVLALDEKHQAARTNLGSALRERGDLERSLECFHTALAAVPGNPETWFGLGNTLKEMGRTREAIDAFRRALELKPDHIDVQVNLSLLLILSGQFPEGWDLYEQRFHRPKNPVRARRFPQPHWQGASLQGEKLLVWGEQGAGDKIMGYRLLNEIAGTAQEIIVETDARLLRLMAFNFPGLTWVAESSPADRRCASATLQSPVLSLARFLRRDLASFGDGAPFLCPVSDDLPPWQDRLAKLSGRKIGLVWAGSPTHQNDAKRSLRLARLSPLFAIPGLSFVSLQMGSESRQIEEANLPIHDFTGHIRDYADTAALAAQLDLVIAVDTSVAHLAGALGVPTWIMIPFHPDWRWLESAAATTPWYRAARLFRQPRYGDWDSVVEEIAMALQAEPPDNAIEMS